MSRRLLIAALPALLTVLPGLASAQVTYRDAPVPFMREGQPAVERPAPPPPDARLGIRSRFRSAYARANSPKMVIFWNREFTDEVGTGYDLVQTSDSYVERHGSGVSASSETRLGVRSTTDNRRESGLSEAGDFDCEQGFQGALGQAGARLVDRTAIMRTTGAARGAGATANVQELETQAILAKADLIIEVTQMGGGGATAYKVVARDLRRAKILAAFRTNGRPPPAPRRYVAGPNGFELATAGEPSSERIGEQVALELMTRMASQF